MSEVVQSLRDLWRELWGDQRMRVLIITAGTIAVVSIIMSLPPAALLAVAIGFLIGTIYIEVTEKEQIEIKLPEKAEPQEVKEAPAVSSELELTGGEKTEVPPPPPEPYAEERLAELEKMAEEQAAEIEKLKKEREKMLELLAKARDKLKEIEEAKAKKHEEAVKQLRASTSFVDLAKKYNIDPVVLDSIVSALEGMSVPQELPPEWFLEFIEDKTLLKKYIVALRKLKFKIVKKGKIYELQ